MRLWRYMNEDRRQEATRLEKDRTTKKQDTEKTEIVGLWQKLEKKTKKLQTTFAFAAY